ncbi:MAG: TadE/TadG family protein [Alphaproteobacteria bacterium]|nr:TadE/TadG family protein [Alphaproteobacteria bacterium]
MSGTKIFNTARHLTKDTQGGSAIMIAFAIPVVIGALGIALDTGMWYLNKRQMQQMADTASLGAVRTLASGGSVTTAKQVAMNDAVRNGYVASEGSSLTVNSPPTSGAYAGDPNAVEVVVSRRLPLFFSAYFLSGSQTVSARSVSYQSSVLGKNLEVSMMLDVSSSMGGNSEIRGTTKLEAMQDAAKSLVDIVVQPAQTPFTSRVAIVPYSSAVNVGSTYFKPVTNKTLSGSWSSVVERAGSSAFTDDAPASNKWLGSFKTKKSSALGAYSSTVKNYSSNVPSSSLMSPLSTDKTALKATISAFTASGTTAGHIGVAWTWYTLSPKWSNVFTGGKTPNAYDSNSTLKVVVLLSDFDMNSYYESANGNSSVQTQQLCTNMKAAGITIYTVAYGLDTSNSTAVNLWKGCSSSVDTRFSTTTVDGLKAAFKTIAQVALGGVSTVTPVLVE